MALNGGPQFKFTEANSFAVNCETQDEIDYFWEKLPADGGVRESARGFAACCGIHLFSKTAKNSETQSGLGLDLLLQVAHHRHAAIKIMASMTLCGEVW